MHFPRFTWPDASVGTWTVARAIKAHCWTEWRVTLSTSQKPGMPKELSRFRTLLDKTRCMRTGAQKAQVCYIAILRRNEMPKLHSGAAFCIRCFQFVMFFVVSGLATFPSTSRPLSSISRDYAVRRRPVEECPACACSSPHDQIIQHLRDPGQVKRFLMRTRRTRDPWRLL